MVEVSWAAISRKIMWLTTSSSLNRCAVLGLDVAQRGEQVVARGRPGCAGEVPAEELLEHAASAHARGATGCPGSGARTNAVAGLDAVDEGPVDPVQLVGVGERRRRP